MSVCTFISKKTAAETVLMVQRVFKELGYGKIEV